MRHYFHLSCGGKGERIGLPPPPPGTAPKNYVPSLATSCKNVSSNSARILGKSRNFQIVYAGRTNLCKHCTTDHVRGMMKQWGSPSTLSHCRGPISLSLPLAGSNEIVTISSAWRVQPPTGVKRVHVNSLDVEGTVFKHSKTTSNIILFNLSSTSR